MGNCQMALLIIVFIHIHLNKKSNALRINNLIVLIKSIPALYRDAELMGTLVGFPSKHFYHLHSGQECDGSVMSLTTTSLCATVQTFIAGTASYSNMSTVSTRWSITLHLSIHNIHCFHIIITFY